MKMRFGKNQKLVIEAITLSPAYLSQDEIYNVDYLVSASGLTEKQVLGTLPSLIKKNVFKFSAGAVLEPEVSHRGDQTERYNAEEDAMQSEAEAAFDAAFEEAVAEAATEEPTPEVEPEVEVEAEVEVEEPAVEAEPEVETEAEPEDAAYKAQWDAVDELILQRLALVIMKMRTIKGWVRKYSKAPLDVIPDELLTMCQNSVNAFVGTKMDFLSDDLGYVPSALKAVWDGIPEADKLSTTTNIFRSMLLEDEVDDGMNFALGLANMQSLNKADFVYALVSAYKESFAKYFSLYTGKISRAERKRRTEEHFNQQKQRREQEHKRWREALDAYRNAKTPEQQLTEFADKVGYVLTGNAKKDCRRMASQLHPDRKGGNEELMKELNGIKDLLFK